MILSYCVGPVRLCSRARVSRTDAGASGWLSIRRQGGSSLIPNSLQASSFNFNHLCWPCFQAGTFPKIALAGSCFCEKTWISRHWLWISMSKPHRGPRQRGTLVPYHPAIPFRSTTNYPEPNGPEWPKPSRWIGRRSKPSMSPQAGPSLAPARPGRQVFSFFSAGICCGFARRAKRLDPDAPAGPKIPPFHGIRDSMEHHIWIR
jgi:hypothetical protein